MMPALLTRMSRRDVCAWIASAAALADGMSVKSNLTKTRLFDWPGVVLFRRSIAFCAFSSFRHKRKILQPFLWSS